MPAACLLCLVAWVGCGDDAAPPQESVCAVECGMVGSSAAADGSTGNPGSPGVDASSPAPVPDAGCQCEHVPRFVASFASAQTRSCAMASPRWYSPAGGDPVVVTVALDGLVRGLDPGTGETRWSFRIPAPEGQTPIVLSSPVVRDDTMFVAYQEADEGEGLPDQGSWRRRRHVLSALDLERREVDERFGKLVLEASEPSYDGGVVRLQSRYQLLRSDLQHVGVADREGGLLYVSLGNGPSIQPFHGWVFEVDVDAWRADAGTAVTGVLLTTAENDCTPGGPIRDTMVCGGGVWTPGGILVDARSGDDYSLFVPTGNGRVDYSRGAYAHSVLRTKRGLSFDAGCDAAACESFDELDPSTACLESCQNVFSARLPQGEVYELPHSKCDGMTFLECYGRLDADFGSSSPVVVQVPDGPRVVVQAGKDGALYLFDAEHLGTLYQREQALTPCGTDESACPAFWTGNFVTSPVVAEVEGRPVVVVSGFNFDAVHQAGVVAYSVDMGPAGPRLHRLWRAPEEASPRAFRFHSGRPLRFDWEGEPYVAVVETTRGNGRLWVVRVADGDVVQRLDLGARGLKYSKPLLVDDTLFVASCTMDALGEGQLLGLSLEAARREISPDSPGAGPDADSPGPASGDGAGADRACEPGGSRCAADEYCDRGPCDGPGLCRARPTDCQAPDAGDVCACDGQRYASACAAHAMGTSVDPAGNCQ